MCNGLVNVAKGSFRLVPVMYLEMALKHIDEMLSRSMMKLLKNMLK